MVPFNGCIGQRLKGAPIPRSAHARNNLTPLLQKDHNCAGGSAKNLGTLRVIASAHAVLHDSSHPFVP